MKNGVCDGRSDAHECQFAYSLYTQRVHERIVLFHKDRFKSGDVGVSLLL